MPIYEYRCEECGHQFEILQRLGAGSDGLTCPTCGAPELEKMFSTFAASAPEGQAAMPAGGDCGPGGL